MSNTYRKAPHYTSDPTEFIRGHIKFDVKHNTNGYLGEDIRSRKKLFKKKRNKKLRKAQE